MRFTKPSHLVGMEIEPPLNQLARSANSYKSRAEVVEVLTQLVSIKTEFMDRFAAIHCMPRTAC